MNGKNIGSIVNRAFIVVGILFALGGVYLGALMWLMEPEYITVIGTIRDLRVERARPLGFENVPLDSTDPSHKNIPININTFATVDYRYDGKDYSAGLVSWGDEVTWKVGDEIPLYFPENEPEYPSDYLPESASSGKRTAVLAGSAMSVMGWILVIVSITMNRREERRKRATVEEVERLARAPVPPPNIAVNRTVLENKVKGNFLIGGILSGIGFILAAALIPDVLGEGELMGRLITMFPIAVGIGLLILGLPEFHTLYITVTEREVKVVRRGIFGMNENRAPVSSFIGIWETILEREMPGQMKRHLYREQSLAHENQVFNELSLAVFPDDARALIKARELSQTLNLPRIQFDGESPYLEYPDGEVVRSVRETDLEDDGEDTGEFPGKYLRLVEEGPGVFLIRRSYTKGLMWSGAVIAIGIVVSVLAGSAIPLVPLGMMGLIIGAVSGKSDRLELRHHLLTVEKSFLGRPYFTEEIRIEDLEDVVIGHDPRMYNAESLELRANGKRLYFGQSANSDALKWIRTRLRGAMEQKRQR